MEVVIKNTEDRMRKCIDSFKKELSGIRTGRASAALVENIIVDYYGTPCPIKQLANISTPEAKQIMIQPFDKGSIGDIDRAIQKSGLGIMPKLDGALIRIILPALTEERRKDLVKGIKKHLEEAKVAIRNVRRDAHDEVKAKKDKKEFTEDQAKHLESEIQKLTDRDIAESEKLVVLKEKEIMEI